MSDEGAQRARQYACRRRTGTGQTSSGTQETGVRIPLILLIVINSSL